MQSAVFWLSVSFLWFYRDSFLHSEDGGSYDFAVELQNNFILKEAL